MKPSQFAKGFQARPDITTSEKRTALDRLNAIDGIVKSETPTPAPTKSAKKDIAPLPAAELTLDPSIDESAQYRAWRLENRYAPGQVIELPLKAIKHSPFNPRHFYLKSSIAELAVNLAKQGQQQAIHVIPDYENPGTYFVSDGGRRVRALKEANKESVKAIVIDVPIGIRATSSATISTSSAIHKRCSTTPSYGAASSTTSISRARRSLRAPRPRRIDGGRRAVDRQAAGSDHAGNGRAP